MKRWEEYQHQAAGLLRELGFNVKVNDLIAEANGTVHAIDVAARRTVAGVDLLWVVECKFWNRRVPMEKVAALKAIVDAVGADRGVLMSESGFQSGSIRMAIQKNITLTSMADLRGNASEELLAARVSAAEKRLMSLALRVNRDFRATANPFPRYLVAMATRLRPEDVEELAGRPAAVDWYEGVVEVLTRITGRPFRDDDPLLPLLDERPNSAVTWRAGMDEAVMDRTATSIDKVAHALAQGRLGDWPVSFVVPGDGKVAWSMPQLVDAVEHILGQVERTVAEQEDKASRQPKQP